MFNKIIGKRSGRKKHDSGFENVSGSGNYSGGMSMSAPGMRVVGPIGNSTASRSAPGEGQLGSKPVAANHGSRNSASLPGPAAGRSFGIETANGLSVFSENIPSFREVSGAEKQNLFLKKLSICCYLFDFMDTSKHIREKEIKRQTLLELLDFVQSGSYKLTESLQEELVKMLAENIFRSLPPAAHENTGTETLDPEEDEPSMDPSWPHLQIIYEMLLRYVVSTDTDPKIAKRYIDHSFVLKLLDLFDSEDPREREYLKTILHRIYGKFMVHRPFIRKAINNIFYRFIMETERHCGIGELLEILGSIINGFALPMKEEHKLFLDYKLADTVIRGLLKFWPVTNCQKEVLFLGELEEILEATQLAEFQCCMVPLFHQISRCLRSLHFQSNYDHVWKLALVVVQSICLKFLLLPPDEPLKQLPKVPKSVSGPSEKELQAKAEAVGHAIWQLWMCLRDICNK